MNEFPTIWQRKTMWSALAALAVVTIGAISVGLVWLVSTVIGLLQPILIPFAIAGVMAYLLEPVVAKIASWGTSRQRAVISVFALVTVVLAGLMLWIIPAIWMQTGRLVQRIPTYRDAIVLKVGQFNAWTRSLEKKYGVQIMPQIPERVENPLAPLDKAPETKPPVEPPAIPLGQVGPSSAGASVTVPTTPPAAAVAVDKAPDSVFDLQGFLKADWVQTTLGVVFEKTKSVFGKSIGGFLGVFGFLLSMIIVPIYLYYFLIESRNIAQSWGDYLPLRASEFKDEVVAAFNEINGYLIAFFRGQLLVSLINGTATGILLMAVGLDFGLLIGLMLCFLGIIPYLGIILCWIPAVIIASVQGGVGTWIPSEHWWVFPLVVTLIFVVVQQIDGLFITPKIVGESVGLHPMTVMASVFFWSLLIGGLLGAIVAVPLTATIKVLLRRYVWQRTLFPNTAMATEETVAIQQAQKPDKPAATPSSP
ncbi:MAG: AI-2E family transporter [Chthoniobacter sp.]|nr:AI-2E family transporter [Chthoniobacter sp.]